MISSLLNLVYLGEIVIRGFFAAPSHKVTGLQEAPLSMLIPLSLTALLTLIMFFNVDFFIIDFSINDFGAAHGG